MDIRDAGALSWSAGDAAAEHDVYFGTDKQAVANADTSSTLYKGRQAKESYSLAGLVEFGGGTYFWRIDEVDVDGTVHTGNVWGFSVPDYLIVDDFEAYNDEEGSRIFDVWIDGWAASVNGAMVGYINSPFAEQNAVHGGGQAMPLDYNNVNAPFYSEAERTFASVQDWTTHGVNALTLYFVGKVNNGLDRLYVALEDSAGKLAVVAHADPEAVRAVKWVEWKIPLSQFAGINPAKVKKLVIGVGDRAQPVAGGAGRLLIDDIRVTKP